tara:strand:- start:362 stop:592 length:231 start_codon:yes stop_codon:yes gene_type:complete
MSKCFKIKKGANLSRCKTENGVLMSDNITTTRTLYLTDKNFVEKSYNQQVDCSFYEFKNKTYGEFIVEANDLTINQ